MLVATMVVIAGSGIYVEFKITAGGEAKRVGGTMKSWASINGSSRTEMNMMMPQMPNGSMKVISIHKAAEPDKVYIQNDASKTYSVTDMSKFKSNHQAGQKDKPIQIEVLGKEKVNGYNCTHVKITRKGNQAQDLWTTKEIADFDKYARIQSNKYFSDEGMMVQLKAKGADGVPVRMRMAERSGDMQMDLIKAEKVEVSDAQFQIPNEYKESTGMYGGNIPPNVAAPAGMPTPEQMQQMTPEMREKWMRELQQKYGKHE